MSNLFYPRSSQGTRLTGWSKSPTSPQPFSGTEQSLNLQGEIAAISIDGISAAEIDVTALTDNAKKFILGVQDGGTVTVQAFAVTLGVGDEGSLPQTGNSTPQNFRLHFPKKPTNILDPESEYAVVFIFAAYLQSVAYEAAVDDAVRITYTLRISGPVQVDWTYTTQDIIAPPP